MSKKDPKTRKVTFNDNHECLFMQTLPIINGKTIDVDDMADVKDINEVDLLYNVLNRLKIKKTFTNVGPTLLIVNPFTRIEGVYGEEQIEYYLAKHEKENGNLVYKVNITVKAALNDNQYSLQEREEMAQVVADKINSESVRIFNQAVNEYDADLFGIYKLSKHYQPKMYLEYENDFNALKHSVIIYPTVCCKIQ